MPVARHGALPTRLAQGRLDAKIINPSRLAFNTESLRWLPTLSVNRACAGSLCRNAWDKCEVGMARGFPIGNDQAKSVPNGHDCIVSGHEVVMVFERPNPESHRIPPDNVWPPPARLRLGIGESVGRWSVWSLTVNCKP